MTGSRRSEESSGQKKIGRKQSIQKIEELRQYIVSDNQKSCFIHLLDIHLLHRGCLLTSLLIWTLSKVPRPFNEGITIIVSQIKERITRLEKTEMCVYRHHNYKTEQKRLRDKGLIFTSKHRDTLHLLTCGKVHVKCNLTYQAYLYLSNTIYKLVLGCCF